MISSSTDSASLPGSTRRRALSAPEPTLALQASEADAGERRTAQCAATHDTAMHRPRRLSAPTLGWRDLASGLRERSGLDLVRLCASAIGSMEVAGPFHAAKRFLDRTPDSPLMQAEQEQGVEWLYHALMQRMAGGWWGQRTVPVGHTLSQEFEVLEWMIQFQIPRDPDCDYLSGDKALVGMVDYCFHRSLDLLPERLDGLLHAMIHGAVEPDTLRQRICRRFASDPLPTVPRRLHMARGVPAFCSGLWSRLPADDRSMLDAFTVGSMEQSLAWAFRIEDRLARQAVLCVIEPSFTAVANQCGFEGSLVFFGALMQRDFGDEGVEQAFLMLLQRCIAMPDVQAPARREAAHLTLQVDADGDAFYVPACRLSETHVRKLGGSGNWADDGRATEVRIPYPGWLRDERNICRRLLKAQLAGWIADHSSLPVAVTSITVEYAGLAGSVPAPRRPAVRRAS